MTPIGSMFQNYRYSVAEPIQRAAGPESTIDFIILTFEGNHFRSDTKMIRAVVSSRRQWVRVAMIGKPVLRPYFHMSSKESILEFDLEYEGHYNDFSDNEALNLKDDNNDVVGEADPDESVFLSFDERQVAEAAEDDIGANNHPYARVVSIFGNHTLYSFRPK